MKITYTLSDEDVREILADRFHTSVSNTQLVIDRVSRGYGMNEYGEDEMIIVNYEVTIVDSTVKD